VSQYIGSWSVIQSHPLAVMGTLRTSQAIAQLALVYSSSSAEYVKLP
jgi:hypothetical protein